MAVDMGSFGPFEPLFPAEFIPEPETGERKTACPSYTRGIFNPETFPGIVDWAAAEILKQRPKIGAVAGCGHSGVLVAAAVGYVLRLPVIAVRKDGDTDTGHDSEEVNACLLGTERYIIIDDLVASGLTIQRIVKHVACIFPQATPAGVLLYNDGFTDIVYVNPELKLPTISMPTRRT